jgi:hypothetical protein
MSQNFESAFPAPGWSAFDDDGAAHGEYYWDEDNHKPNFGAMSAWCAKGGADGVDPDVFSYPNNAKAWMVFGPFDLSGFTSAQVGFYYWNKSEPNFDWFSWEASIDGENFYGSPDGSSVSGDSGGWKQQWFNLSNVDTIGNLAGQDQVWFAFIFESNDSVNEFDGPFVDDIALWGWVEGTTDTFPFNEAPNYDSGWGAQSQGDWNTFFHNLGGDTDHYVVDVIARDTDADGWSGRGINQQGFGGDYAYVDGFEEYGYYWGYLNATSVAVYRFANDRRADEVRVRIWLAPLSAYDSGWTDIDPGADKRFLHNLRGDPANYMVDMEFYDPDGRGVNTRMYGLDTYHEGAGGALRTRGAAWWGLTDTAIHVHRGEADINADQVRIRIWNAPPPDYDSGWTAIAADTAKSFQHNLGGSVNEYYVHLQFQQQGATGYGVNRWYYGMDTTWEDDWWASGSYWRNLDEKVIEVVRAPADFRSPEARIRIWFAADPGEYLPLVVQNR